MTAPSVLNFLSHRASLSYSCPHPPTYLETYHLHSAELHTRAPRERLPHTSVVHQYDATPEEHMQPERDVPLMTLHRSLTPPPPTASALSSLSHSLAPLTSSSTSTMHANSSSSHLSLLCSTFPSHTVVRQSHTEQPLLSNLVGGWKAEAGTVSRLATRTPFPSLIDVVPLPNVLWQLVLEYSGDVYQQADAHVCHADVELCRWATKHSIQPAPLMVDWMKAVMQDAGKMLVEHSRYQRFDTSGAGWSHQHFLAFAHAPLSTACASVLHPCTSSTFYLSKASVEAYRSYHMPNILESYSYARPPFQFPPVQGYIQRIGIVVNLPLDTARADDSSGRQAEEGSGGGLSPTLSVATTAESPESQSPLSMSTLSLSPALSPTPQPRPSITSYDHLYLSVLSPRRSSLPTYSSSSSSSPASSSPVPLRSPAASPPLSSPSSPSKLPTDVFFNQTWSVADSLYRHGVRSVLSDFLQVDVPRGACPWRSCSRVEFAYTFMPSEQQPQPCFIMHR